MSQSDVEVVEGGWAAFTRGDFKAALDVYAEDVEWDVSRDVWGDLVGGGVYRGLAGIQSWMRDLYDGWEEFAMVCDEVIDAGGDRVVSVLTARGRARVSGIEFEHHPAGVATVSAGKLIRVEWYPTRADALAAVGLSEP